MNGSGCILLKFFCRLHKDIQKSTLTRIKYRLNVPCPFSLYGIAHNTQNTGKPANGEPGREKFAQDRARLLQQFFPEHSFTGCSLSQQSTGRLVAAGKPQKADTGFPETQHE